MPLKFHCVCGQALIVSRKLVGHGVRCPQCDTKVKVPTPRASPVPPPHATSEATASHLAASHLAVNPLAARTSVAEGAVGGSDLGMRTSVVNRPAPPPVHSEVRSPDGSAEEVSQAGAEGDVIHGYEPHPREVSAARGVAWGLAVVAGCGLVAPIWDIVSHFRVEGSPGIAIWAFVAIWIALVQAAYAAYVAQLPDWSTLWVTTCVTLALSVGYAMLLGLTSLARPDSWVAERLELTDHLAGGRAAGWCFIMLCLTSATSYFSGRLSTRWRQAYSEG